MNFSEVILTMKFYLLVLVILVANCLASDTSDSTAFIVGGNDALPEQFPYLVSLRRSDVRRHFCSAALVNVRWILTAAHCITGNINFAYELLNVVGTISATSDEGHFYDTELYVLHPDWNPNVFRHDVALIETTEYIEFGPMVFPVRLTPDHFGGGVTATMAGFGQTSQEPIIDNKQFHDMETMTNADCRRFYSRLPFNAVRIFDSNICLFHPEGRGGCGGDSGASITVNQISVGIASWIGGPCDVGSPDVFARTANYYYWIRNVTEINRIEE